MPCSIRDEGEWLPLKSALDFAWSHIFCLISDKWRTAWPTESRIAILWAEFVGSNRDIADGKLVTLLEDINPGDISPITAIFVGQSGYATARVRALLDYLVENVRLD